MSQPPQGPPPPYGYSTPPGVTFVPAPVMMPMYPPPPAGHMEPPPTQPTFVTNHYYPTPPNPQYPPTHQYPPSQQYPPPHYHQPQPPPPSTMPVELPIDWVTVTTATAANYTHRALVAGKEAWDGSPLWVIRAHHSGDFIPGKLAIKNRAAYIPYCGKEIPVHSFDILLARPHSVQWVSASHGHVPPRAVMAGNTHSGEPLYVARAHHKRSITPGKLHPSHNCAYISYGGEEISYKNYEVLCQV